MKFAYFIYTFYFVLKIIIWSFFFDIFFHWTFLPTTSFYKLRKYGGFCTLELKKGTSIIQIDETRFVIFYHANSCLFIIEGQGACYLYYKGHNLVNFYHFNAFKWAA